MGGKRKSSSSCAKSFFSMFFKLSGRQHHSRRDVDDLEPRRGGRVWASDEDRDWWVGEHDIDTKATEFIANFYKNRITDSERQTIAVRS